MEVILKFNPDTCDEEGNLSNDGRKLRVHMQAEQVMNFLYELKTVLRDMIKYDTLPEVINYSHTCLYNDNSVYVNQVKFKPLAKFMQDLAEMGCPRDIRKMIFKTVKKRFIPPKIEYTPKTPVHKLPGDIAIDLFRDAFFELAKEHDILTEID